MKLWRERIAFTICGFFFQAEDGIRDDLVTGVQTCALPILVIWMSVANTGGIPAFWFLGWPFLNIIKDLAIIVWAVNRLREELRTKVSLAAGNLMRSEERRVGKECRAGWVRSC